FFDAINHGLTSVSTGGFSTKNLSMAYWNNNPIVQYICMIFMFLGGTNFVLSYYAFKGKFLNVIRDHEFRFYFLLLCVVLVIAGLIILFRADVAMSAYHPMVFGETVRSFRHTLFNVISLLT